MLRWAVVALLATGCYRAAETTGDCALDCTSAACPGGQTCGTDRLCHAIGAQECTSRPLLDAAVGSESISDATLCFGSALITVCLISKPQPTRFLGTQMLDTDVASCDPAMPNGICVIAAENLTIADGVTITGHEPIVFFGTSSLQLSGVTIASSLPGQAGPGAQTSACPAPTDPPSQGGGGGAGGSFQSAGGAGGPSTSGGGSANLTLVPALQGGCSGGPGATGPLPSTGGFGGLGGGAVAFLSPVLTIAGSTKVAADGEGGGGGSERGGGGGGGTGGVVLFGATNLVIAGSGIELSAVGGGGGGGGIDIVDGSAAVGEAGGGAPMDAGGGGNGSIDGNKQGDGAGAGSDGVGGGGGGGGGAGWIFVSAANSPDLGNITATPAIPPP